MSSELCRDDYSRLNWASYCKIIKEISDLMHWLVFFIFVVFVFILLVPARNWRSIWPSGLIGMGALYFIDTTFISLKAFSYNATPFDVNGLPLLYILSGFFNGMLLANYCPNKMNLRLPYVLITSILFLGLELIMNITGDFFYINWSPLKSFFLNIFGFLVVLSLFDILGITKNDRLLKLK